MRLNGVLQQQPQFFVPVAYPVPVAQWSPTWDPTLQQCAATGAPPDVGLNFGTFLAVVATAVSGVVLFDSSSSKAAKEVAKTTLGVSLPFLLTKAFAIEGWPAQTVN